MPEVRRYQLPNSTFGAARFMHQVRAVDKTAQFDVAPSAVDAVLAARAKRARKAEKLALLQARPALGIIKFLCWATGRDFRLTVKTTE